MWKVSNNKNKEYLDKFNSKIIVPLFEFIITLKVNSFTGVNYQDFEKEVNNILGSDFPKIIFKKKHKGNECYELILDLLKTIALKKLQDQIEIFESQNASINIGNFSLKAKKVPKELYIIFSHILYSQCFDDDDCWEYIETGVKYKRTDFHDNFKVDNNDRSICSLCDTDTVIAKSNGIVEHFLPRNKFPYLSMNANNLTTCCNACNLGEQGKGMGSVNPIWAPFSRQIGDNIKFIIETDKIVISPREGNIAVHKIFLSRDILLVENLAHLEQLTVGQEYLFSLLPLARNTKVE